MASEPLPVLRKLLLPASLNDKLEELAVQANKTVNELIFDIIAGYCAEGVGSTSDEPPDPAAYR